MWPVHSLFLLPHWFTFRSFQGLAQCLGLRAFSPWRSAQTASGSHSICHAFHPYSPCDYLLIILQVQLSHTHACLLWVSTCCHSIMLLLLLFSHSIVSDSLRPHGPKHARIPCPSISPSLLKLISIESMIPSNHLILCCPLLFLLLIFPSIRAFPCIIYLP